MLRLPWAKLRCSRFAFASVTITELSQATQHIGQSARQVPAASGDVVKDANVLQVEVARFLKQVRAS